MAITQEALTPAGTEGSRVTGRIIDCDVHPIVKGGMPALLPYMSQAWQARIKPFAGNALRPGGGRYFRPHGPFAFATDAIPPDGEQPGSDPDFIRSNYMDRYGVEVALLVDLVSADLVLAASDPDHAAALIGACNRYLLDRFPDQRLRLAVAVSPHDPDLAVAEINRHAKNQYVAAVFLPITNIRLGRPHYDPIFASAVEHGLPVALHPCKINGLFQGAVEYGSGVAERWTDRMVEIPEVAWTSISSLVMSGTFDRFPDLKLLFLEFGFSWLPPLVSRMDKAWELADPAERPRRRPSEYVRDHIRLATQPVEDPEHPDDLIRMIETHLSDILCFSSDYPHADNDRPGTVLKGLSPFTAAKIYCENSRAVLRL